MIDNSSYIVVIQSTQGLSSNELLANFANFDNEFWLYSSIRAGSPSMRTWWVDLLIPWTGSAMLIKSPWSAMWTLFPGGRRLLPSSEIFLSTKNRQVGKFSSNFAVRLTLYSYRNSHDTGRLNESFFSNVCQAGTWSTYRLLLLIN